MSARVPPAIDFAPRDDPYQRQQAMAHRHWAEATRSFVEFPREAVDGSVVQRFEHIARLYAERVAVKSDRQTLTYTGLNEIANRLARTLVAKIGTQNEPVAFLLEQSAAPLIAMIGALKAGKIGVTLDSTHPTARLDALLDDSQARLIITNSANLALARELAHTLSPMARSMEIVNLDEPDAGLAANNLGLAIAPDAFADIVYTSGSTGQPKGILRQHRQLLHYVMADTNACRVCCEDRRTQLFPYSSVTSTWSAFSAVLNGAMLLEKDLKPTGVGPLAEWLIQNDATIVTLSTGIFRKLLENLPDANEQRFPKLRLLDIGGEQITDADIVLWKQHFSPDCILSYGFASTEADWVTQLLMDKAAAFSTGVNWVGYPIADQEVVLVDEDGAPVPYGQVGEITAKSCFLSTGYWRRPELTQMAFKPDPDGGDKRVCFTGDLGRIRSDGSLEWIGRKDFQVKIRGNRVQPAEVEMALLDMMKFKEAVVTAALNKVGDQRLIAYLVSKAQPPPTTTEMRDALKQKLPDYMIPSAFVYLDTLPRNANGKVDRKALPAPEQRRPDTGVPLVMPRDRFELEVAHVWEDLLGIYPIGVMDRFFDLGGDSLMAETMLLEIGKKYGRALPSRILFDASTVDQLAALLRQEGWQPAWSSVVAIQPKGSKPPLFCFPPLNAAFAFRSLAAYLGPDQPVYALLATPEGNDNPFIRIEDEATYYKEQLRSIQSRGPYYLTGWSYGGIAAFEVAQQLAAQDQEVAFLGILDVGFDLQDFRSRAAYFGRRLRYVRGLGWRGQMQRAGTRVKLLASKQAPDPNRKQPISLPACGNDSLGDWTRGISYKPRAYPGHVTLFQTRHDDYQSLFRDPLGGWGRLARGGLEVHEIPGDHGTMMIEPNVQGLAEKFRATLVRAQDGKTIL